MEAVIATSEKRRVRLGVRTRTEGACTCTEGAHMRTEGARTRQGGGAYFYARTRTSGRVRIQKQRMPFHECENIVVLICNTIESIDLLHYKRWKINKILSWCRHDITFSIE